MGAALNVKDGKDYKIAFDAMLPFFEQDEDSQRLAGKIYELREETKSSVRMEAKMAAIAEAGHSRDAIWDRWAYLKIEYPEEIFSKKVTLKKMS